VSVFGIIGIVIGVLVLLLIGTQLPEIRRYLKIKMM
jgi:hypothetical protein